MLLKLRSGDQLTSRNEIELVLLLAVPALMEHLSMVLMSYIDAAMVGHLGANESAAVGLVSPSLWLFWGVSGACITGFAVQASHRIGAGDYEQARSVLRQALSSIFVLAVILATIGWLIHDSLPNWLGGQKQIHDDASAYFLIMVGFFPAVLMNWLGANFLQAAGDMRTPSMVSALMCLLDVVFNWFLIYPTREVVWLGMNITMPGADLGVAGAAWGSVLAETVAASLMIGILVTRSPILRLKGTRGSFVLQKQVFKRAVHIGVPIGIERALMCGAQVVSTVIVAPLGVVTLAAHSLAITAESLCYMPGYGVSEAATTLVGQSIGARRYDLAKRLAVKSVICGVVVMSLMGGVLFTMSDAFMSWMSKVPEVIDQGAQVLRIQAWAEPMFAVAIICHGIFMGAGDTLVPSVINFVSVWAIRLVAAFFLAPVWGLSGVWIAMCVEIILRGIAYLIRLRSGAWLRHGAKLQEECSK